VTAGAEALALLEQHDELGIVLVGGPTTSTTPGSTWTSGQTPRLLRGQPHPVRLPALWGRDTRSITPNMYWSYGRKILQAAKIVSEHPHLHIIYMTNFKCGPDSYIKHYIGAASPEPFLVLQFDEHTNDAGAMTAARPTSTARASYAGGPRRQDQAAGKRALVETQTAAKGGNGRPTRAAVERP